MQPTHTATVQSAAMASPCGRYRYWLSRTWDETRSIGAFIGINPSKADVLRWDQTLCNCNNLALKWGWGGFYMLNLYAYYATKPKDLLAAQASIDIIGSQNNQVIQDVVKQVDIVVLAWGNDFQQRANEVRQLIGKRPLFCIKKNQGGGYRHPVLVNNPEDYPTPIPVE